MTPTATPVLFVHGLWLHATSWTRWVDLFAAAGYAPVAPGWPDDPDTVELARQHPDRIAGHGIDDVAAHYAEVIDGLDAKPILIGHSFGGTIVEKLLGQDLGAAAIAIDAAPIKGVLPLPISSLRTAFPVLKNPANKNRAISLTPEQFRYGFGNAISAEESDSLYERWTIKAASRSLKWAVSEMERRYRDLAGWGVRNIDGYNNEIMRRNLVQEYDDSGEPWKPLPYIVIIIDELADLMMTSGREVEESITRLAQMARAVGIHLVLATQRPSVDVITGLIKANFPSRISFRVSSKVDSRTIIDTNGAEQLLGRGDMLFLPPGTSRLVRVHGAYIDETEIGKIVANIKAQGAPAYDTTITQSEEEALGLTDMDGDRDEMFEEALRICVEMKRASTSVLQRRLRIGYGRAAAILDMMEREGLIGQADGSRPRPVLGKAYEMIAEWDEQGEVE